MSRIVGKLTYANVMATIAVFVALGGAGYAATKLPQNSVGTRQIKNNAITGAKIKNGAVSGAKIDLAGLGQVPSAANATSAATAATATNAAHATTATNADHASQAANADHASVATDAGHATTADSASALAAPEPVHFVTEFENGFRNSGEGLEKAGFYLDRQCEVHLQGSVVGNSPRIAFNLPEGFRPPGDIFASIPTGVEPGYLEIFADGSVRVGFFGEGSGERTFGLDGVTFRVAGC
jgi:hypothetical protein